jgi:hypothetical protein
MMKPELMPLDRLLCWHDWYYDYSDDYSVWKRGQSERDAINAEQRRLISSGLATADEITALSDKYRPKNG